MRRCGEVERRGGASGSRTGLRDGGDEYFSWESRMGWE
jgi:hypothetical protein